MSYQNSSQSFMRTAVRIGTRQQVRSRRTLSIPGSALLWKSLLKPAIIILPVTLLLNIFISSAVSTMDRSILQAEQALQEVEDENIVLLAQKARVWAPSNVEMLAGEKLSLLTSVAGKKKGGVKVWLPSSEEKVASEKPTVFTPVVGEKQVSRFDRGNGTLSYL